MAFDTVGFSGSMVNASLYNKDNIYNGEVCLN